MPIIMDATEIDDYLFDKGNWDGFRAPSRFYVALKTWLRCDPADLRKTTLAAETIRSFISLYQGPSDHERSADHPLIEIMQYLDQNLVLVLSAIGREFYRDHVHHSLRVAILANAILTKYYESIGNPSNMRLPLVGAGLLHDVGYYLSRFVEGVESLHSAICNAYIIATKEPLTLNLFNHNTYIRHWVTMSSFIPELHKAATPFKKEITHSIEHNIISAIEAAEILQWIGKDSRLLQTYIIRHDPSYHHVFVDCRRGRIDPASIGSVVIILADELQDWGREGLYIEDNDPLRIVNIALNADELSVYYSVSNPRIPLIEIILDKYNNLQRIVPLMMRHISLHFPMSGHIHCTGLSLYDTFKEVSVNIHGHDKERVVHILDKLNLDTMKAFYESTEGLGMHRMLDRIYVLIGGKYDVGCLLIPSEDEYGENRLEEIIIEWDLSKGRWHIKARFGAEVEYNIKRVREIDMSKKSGRLEIQFIKELITFIGMVGPKLMLNTESNIVNALVNLNEMPTGKWWYAGIR